MSWPILLIALFAILVLLVVLLKRRLSSGANIHEDETIEVEWHDTGSNPSFSRLPHNVHHTLTPDLTESTVLSPGMENEDVTLGQTGTNWHQEINPFMETGQITLSEKDKTAPEKKK